MAQNKILNIPQQFIPVSVANLLNPALGSVAGPVGFTMTQPYLIIKHVRVTNIDTATRTISCYKGATGGSAAGTQVFWGNQQIAAQSYLDWYGQLRVDSADFITGVCDVASKVVIEFDAEIGVA